jgi:hypothetical protein
MTPRMIYFLATVLAVAVAPTGLSAQQSMQNLFSTLNSQTNGVGQRMHSINGQDCGRGTSSPNCSGSIGDMFGKQMQTNKSNLQNRSGSIKTAPSGSINSMSRNVK